MALLVVVGAVLVPGAVTGAFELWLRLLSLVGIVSAVLGIRMMVGAVLIVRDEGLRIQKSWPRRRDIAWYRILATDVIPGFWNLELELNSGERLELPPSTSSIGSTPRSSATAPRSTPDHVAQRP